MITKEKKSVTIPLTALMPKKDSVLSETTPFDSIPMVDSFEDVNPYQVVQTMNYSLIKDNPYNRERDLNKVTKFETLIGEGNFFHKSTIILVDYVTKLSVDSQHKMEALKNTNNPIIFMVVDLGEEFRGKESVKNIAKLNDTNSKWNSANKFERANKFAFKTANLLKGLESDLDVSVPKNNFKPWNVLNFALGKNCESSITLEDYDNNSYAKILMSKKFTKDFKALTKIIKVLKLGRGFGIRPSETLKRLSILNGKNEIDLTIFAKKFNLYASDYYNPTNKNRDNVDNAILSINRKRI